MQDSVDDLIWRHLEGATTPEETSALDAALRNSPATRRRLLHLSAMYDVFCSSPVLTGTAPVSAPGTATTAPQGSGRVIPFSIGANRRVAAAAAILSIAAVGFAGLWAARHGAFTKAPPRVPPAAVSQRVLPPASRVPQPAAADADDAQQPRTVPVATNTLPTETWVDGDVLFKDDFNGDASSWMVFTRCPDTLIKIGICGFPAASGGGTVDRDGGKTQALRLNPGAAKICRLGVQLKQLIEVPAFSVEFVCSVAGGHTATCNPLCLATESGPKPGAEPVRNDLAVQLASDGWTRVRIEGVRHTGADGQSMVHARWFRNGTCVSQAEIATTKVTVMLEVVAGTMLFDDVVVRRMVPSQAARAVRTQE